MLCHRRRRGQVTYPAGLPEGGSPTPDGKGADGQPVLPGPVPVVQQAYELFSDLDGAPCNLDETRDMLGQRSHDRGTPEGAAYKSGGDRRRGPASGVSRRLKAGQLAPNRIYPMR